MVKQPLQHLRVLDFSMAVSGPWAAMLLGALGAQVIKIERPEGDLARGILPTQKGMGTTYLLCNLNKYLLRLDLKSEADRRVAQRLAALSDVVVENLSTGVMDELGLGYSTLRRINPTIIYCSISGYGREGPMAYDGAVDPAVQAFSGWCSVTGRHNGSWEMCRYYAMVDIITSWYAVAGVLQALRWRHKTGEGQRVDISMLEAAIAHQATRLSEYLAANVPPAPMGSAHAGCIPDQAFQCGDGQYLAVSVAEEGQWVRLCQALDVAHLAHDERFSSNQRRVEWRETLIPVLEQAFQQKPAAWWVRQLTQFKVPHSRFFSFELLRHHPQVLLNGCLEDVSTPWGALFSGGLPWPSRGAPWELHCFMQPSPNGRELIAHLGVGQ